VVVLGALGLGLLVGGRDSSGRAATGLISGVRFSALGLIIIGTQLSGNPGYLGPAIVFSLVDTIVAVFVAVEMGRRASAVQGDSSPPDQPSPRPVPPASGGSS